MNPEPSCTILQLPHPRHELPVRRRMCVEACAGGAQNDRWNKNNGQLNFEGDDVEGSNFSCLVRFRKIIFVTIWARQRILYSQHLLLTVATDEAKSKWIGTCRSQRRELVVRNRREKNICVHYSARA